MISGSAFQELGAVIDEIADREMTVLDVVMEGSSLATSRRLSVQVVVGLDSLSELSAAENVRVAPCETADPDGPVKTTFAVEIPVSAGASTEQEPSDEVATDGHQPSAGSDVSEETDTVSGDEAPEEVPYYKNYELLARVYEEHDTFAEMTAALGVDVTPATVREHMVNHGIHPTSTDAGDGTDTEGSDDEDTSDVEPGNGDGQSLTIEADGYGLPEGVTMDSLARAVQQSRTLFEAQTELGLDRQTTRSVLADLDLLEFVTSRIAADRTTDLEDVVDRIHAASTV
jgi:hypothetical protein